MEFKTISFKSIIAKPEELNAQVNALLKEGWSLHGGNCVLEGGEVSQTMVLREAIPIEEARAVGTRKLPRQQQQHASQRPPYSMRPRHLTLREKAEEAVRTGVPLDGRVPQEVGR